MKFVVTDLTKPGIWSRKVEFGQQARLVGVHSNGDAVESAKGLPAIADVAKPVQAADVQTSKDYRVAPAKKSQAEASELESELHFGDSHSVPKLALRREPRKICTGDSGLRMSRSKGTISNRLTSDSSAAIWLR